MSGGIATYGANSLLDVLVGQGWTPPATVYFGLYTALPTDTAAGTEMDSVTEPGYARVAVTNNSTNFPNAASAAKTVGLNVVFPTNSGASAWANAVGWGLWDASTSGNRLTWGPITPLACPAGQAITIPSGTTIATMT